MVLPQAMAWVQYLFRVLSLKFCGKSKKNCGDISQVSPAFCIYVITVIIKQPTSRKNTDSTVYDWPQYNETRNLNKFSSYPFIQLSKYKDKSILYCVKHNTISISKLWTNSGKQCRTWTVNFESFTWLTSRPTQQQDHCDGFHSTCALSSLITSSVDICNPGCRRYQRYHCWAPTLTIACHLVRRHRVPESLGNLGDIATWYDALVSPPPHFWMPYMVLHTRSLFFRDKIHLLTFDRKKWL